MKLKKRIIGFLLLIGIVLIIIPLFFGRSIPSDELKLSGRVPAPPPKPKAIAAPLPLRSATVPEIMQASKPATENSAASSVVFEQLESTANASSENPAAGPTASTAKTLAATALPARPLLSKNEHPASDTSVTKTSKVLAPSVKPKASPSAQPMLSIPNDTLASHKVMTPAELLPLKISSAPVQSPIAEVTPSAQPMPIIVATKNAAPQTTAKNTTKKQKKLTKPEQKTTAKSPPKASKLPSAAEAWSVQLGSFSAKANAQKLMQELQSKGFTAYLRTTKTAKGDFIRVLIGPHLQQSEAAQLQSRIQKELNMQGVLVKVGGG